MSNFAGGSGTAEDPYLIENREHLENMENYSFHKQIADIDLSGEIWDPDDNFRSISYDGDGFIIENMTVNDHRYQGLFGYIDFENGEINTLKNITVKNAIMEIPTASHTTRFNGGLIGAISVFLQSEVVIENCHTEFKMIGDAGHLYDNIFEANAGFVGGINIWGEGSKAYITDCSTVAEIQGNRISGGFVGYVDLYDTDNFIRFERCSAEADIYEVASTGFGIFVGSASAWEGDGEIMQFKDCYAIGSMTASPQVEEWVDMVGGFAGGATYGGGDDVLEFENCYAVCDFSGLPEEAMWRTISAGLPGEGEYIFKQWGFYPDHTEASWWSGTESEQHIFITNCYYDADVGGEDCGRDLARTTDEMIFSPNWNTTYIGWDFDSVWAVAPTINYGYPYFGVGDIPFTPVPGGLHQFIEPPTVTRMPARASRVIVKSPEGEGMAQMPDISEDQIIERIIEIDKGGDSVCQQTAERLLERWKDEKINVEGDVRLVVGLSFKERVKVFIEESNLNGVYLNLNSVEHDVINQTSRVNCGDIILDDAELLARILDD